MYLNVITSFTIFITISTATETKPRPHIIYFLVDDVGFNNVGWNNPKINTPFLNQLAKEGVILDQFYSMPFCTPSRTAFMTGLYPQQSGLQRGILRAQEPYGVPTKFKFVSEILRSRAGYATHIIGKWHLGYCNWNYTPLYRGFDSFFGFYAGSQENYYHCNSKSNIYAPISNCTQYNLRLNDKDVHEEFSGKYVHSTEIYTKYVVNVINNHPKNKPLFLYVSLTDAHFPIQPPLKFRRGCLNQPNEARVNLCAAMASTDDAVRQITIELKRRKMYKNSVVVFTSDNGGSVYFGTNNYPLRGNKGNLWEGGTRVPAFVHSPLIKNKNFRHKGIFHIVDWYPTFMYLAGIPPDDSLNLQGVNQWKSISQGLKSARTEFPYHVDVIDGVVIGAVRKNDYKLILSSAGDLDRIITEKETVDQSFNSSFLQKLFLLKNPFNLNDNRLKLFNLANDPSEKYNLADTQPEKVKELKETFQYYQKLAKPAVKRPANPNGNPDNFNNVVSYLDGVNLNMKYQMEKLLVNCNNKKFPIKK